MDGVDRLSAYDPPGHLPDFDGIPKQREQWSDAVSAWFDVAIRRQRKDLAGGKCQYFNQVTCPPKGPVVEQEIVWNAFPGTLRRRWGRTNALLVGDHVLPLSVRMDQPGPYLPGDMSDTLYYRPQDEYCEWRLTRNEQGRIKRVTFTSEPPEYWRALHGDELGADEEGGQGLPFTGDKGRVLELYRQYVDEAVQPKDLVCQADMWLDGGEKPTYRRGDYNPYNRWNTTHGIMHLTHPSNTLQAEIILGGDSTVLRGREGRLMADADVLIACAGYGGNNRCSDPTIGGSVNHLAAQGFGVTLANPVGLYMDHLDMTGWTTPDGDPIAKEWFQVLRGAPGLIERAVFAPPPGEKLTVSDILIGGVPIRHGGQLAEHMTVKLVGLADLGAEITKSPTGFGYAACAEATNPWMVSSRGRADKCRLGQLPVFTYAEALSAARFAGEEPKAEADAGPPPISHFHTRAS